MQDIFAKDASPEEQNQLISPDLRKYLEKLLKEQVEDLPLEEAAKQAMIDQALTLVATNTDTNEVIWQNIIKLGQENNTELQDDAAFTQGITVLLNWVEVMAMPVNTYVAKQEEKRTKVESKQKDLVVQAVPESDLAINTNQTGTIRKTVGYIGQQISQYLAQYKKVAEVVKIAGETSDLFLKLTIYAGARLTGHNQEQAYKHVARFNQGLSKLVQVVTDKYSLT